MKPYRGTVYVCFVGQDDAGEDDWWDRLTDALDAIGGTFFEGGSSEVMEDVDIIPGSPLDRALSVAKARAYEQAAGIAEGTISDDEALRLYGRPADRCDHCERLMTPGDEAEHDDPAMNCGGTCLACMQQMGAET